MHEIKERIKAFCIRWGIDLTRNIAYDRRTLAILSKTLGPTSNGIDVGCHKGEMLAEMTKRAPQGTFFAFEPLPDFYNEIKIKFGQSQNIRIFPFAVGETAGRSTFQYVRNAPAYSGFKRRDYAVELPEIEEITVEVRSLDELIPEDIPIRFIKIDVEGGEWAVLQGAKRLFRQYKPVTLFEFGLGAADHYGTKPEWVFDFFVEFSMTLNTLKGFLNGATPLTRDNFIDLYLKNKEYYFVASGK